MRALLQRVREASVTVDAQCCGRIGAGILALIGIEESDGQQDIDWLCRKISQLRIFDDDAGVMNRSVLDVGGEVLAVSQFTLYASLRKGNRPSYSRAAPAQISRPLFDRFVTCLGETLKRPVPTGIFGAEMQVALTNDGPITLWLDSRAPE